MHITNTGRLNNGFFCVLYAKASSFLNVKNKFLMQGIHRFNMKKNPNTLQTMFSAIKKKMRIG